MRIDICDKLTHFSSGESEDDAFNNLCNKHMDTHNLGKQANQSGDFGK